MKKLSKVLALGLAVLTAGLVTRAAHAQSILGQKYSFTFVADAGTVSPTQVIQPLTAYTLQCNEPVCMKLGTSDAGTLSPNCATDFVIPPPPVALNLAAGASLNTYPFWSGVNTEVAVALLDAGTFTWGAGSDGGYVTCNGFQSIYNARQLSYP